MLQYAALFPCDVEARTAAARRRVAARSRWRAAFMAVRFVTWTTSLSRENSREGAARDAADGAKAEAAVTEVGEVAAAGPAPQPDASTTRSRGWLYRITAGAPSVRHSAPGAYAARRANSPHQQPYDATTDGPNGPTGSGCAARHERAMQRVASAPYGLYRCGYLAGLADGIMATSRASQLARNSAVLNSAVLPGVSEASGSGESSGLYVAHAAQEDATEDATEPPTPPMRMHRSPRPSQEKMALLRQRYGDAKIQPREGL